MQYDIRSVAQYLEAERLLTNVFKTPFAREAKIERAGSVLATLEVALETSIFEFNYEKLPIDDELVRHFVQKTYHVSPKILSDSAWRFLFRYVSSSPSHFEDEWRPLSFGRISGVIELSEHLLCNDAINTMLLIQRAKTQRTAVAGALDVINGYAQAYVQAGGVNRGFDDFKRFAYNVLDFTTPEFTTDMVAYRAVLECIRPLLANKKLSWGVFKDDLRQRGSDEILVFWEAVEADLASSDAFTGRYASDVYHWSTTRIVG
jgi:hypothetical protein